MTPQSRIVTLACVVLLGTAAVVRADTLDGSELWPDYTIRSWNETQGLMATAILSIAQDHDGYIWLGTDVGLVRFDGVSFVPWNERLPTLPRSRVRTLAIARDGSLWAGFDSLGGIVRIREQTVTHYRQQDGFDDTGLVSVIEDPNGTVWAGTRFGVYRFQNQHWHKLGVREALPEARVYAIDLDGHGDLWVANEVGVFQWLASNDTFRQWEPSHRDRRGFGAETIRGTTWISDPEVGFKAVGDRRRHRSEVKHGNGLQILYDRGGNLWVATSGQGLWRARFKNDTETVAVTALTTANGLLSNDVQALLEDRDGGVWVGTNAGLHQLSPASIRALADVGQVEALEAGQDGNIWLGTDNGLIRISQGRRRRYDEGDGLPSSFVTALHVDRAGTLWVAGSGGIARFVNGHFISIPTAGMTWAPNVRAMNSDARGHLWFQTATQGAFAWDGRQMRPFTADVSPIATHKDVASVYSDKRSRVWFTLRGGRFGVADETGRLTMYQNAAYPSRTVASAPIYEDSYGAIWVVEDDALTKIQDGKVTHVRSTNGLPGGLSSMVEDEAGYLWIGTSAGLIRLLRSEVEKVEHDRSHQLRFSLYDRSDGMTSSPIRRLGRPQAVRAGDGTLWFVTVTGVAVVDPRRVTGNPEPPRVHLDTVLVDDKRFDPTTDNVIPTNSVRLEIDYTAVVFRSPAKVRFRYRLEGFDRDWFDAGTRRQAIYTRLPSGHHRFQVAAANYEGRWSEPAVWEFYVRPAFYRTTWFAAALFAAMAVMILGLWRLRVWHIRREFELVLAERVRLSRAIHDTLLQGLVGVSLQIDTLSTLLDTSSAARDHLTRLRRHVEEYIREARQSIWNLRSPMLDRRTLADALKSAGENAVKDASVSFEMAVSGTLRECPPPVEEHLLRIGQEAIMNALQHAHPSRLRASLQYDADAIRLQILDDGCGFFITENSVSDHYGLKSMRERAEQIGGHLQIVTKPQEGTRVEVTVPLASDPILQDELA